MALSPLSSLITKTQVTRKEILKSTFPQAYSKDIDETLAQSHRCLLSAYETLEKGFSEATPRFKTKQRPSKHPEPDLAFSDSKVEGERAALAEYKTAKSLSEARREKQERAEAEARAEEENMNRAVAEGTMMNCECCFTDHPMNRMVHCDATDFHWFDYECAGNLAKSQIGASKYELKCMFTGAGGCQAHFAKDQVKLFLDAKSIETLEAIEQEANIRTAGIEGLETCPSCHYAAEYPSVEENKEFRCDNPDCGLVSCRLCRKETHIPKTCQEVQNSQAHSARLRVEEAMSEALIRHCNKCKPPFLLPVHPPPTSTSLHPLKARLAERNPSCSNKP